MTQRDSQRRSPQSGDPTRVTPVRRRMAAELLSKLSALNQAGDHPVIDLARQRLRDQAAGMGMQLVGFTVTKDAIPDPAIDALPRADLDRIDAIARDMRSGAKVRVAELERLASKYPHIPMLRNHLAGALHAAGKRDRAYEIIALAARQFPMYVFAFCNHVMMLLSDGKIDEARPLVETGRRGPVLSLTDFDSTRDTFHISEVTSHASMVGHYMLATGRREAAEVQLELLRKIAPDSPQCRSLTAAMERAKNMTGAAATRPRSKAAPQLKDERRKARPAKKAASAGKGGPKSKGAAPKPNVPPEGP